MSNEPAEDIAVLNVNPDVERFPVDDVQQDIDDIWRELATSPDVIARLGEVDADRSPVTVTTRGARAGVVEAIVISVVAGLSRDAATWLWKEKIWPLLQKEKGGDLTEA